MLSEFMQKYEPYHLQAYLVANRLGWEKLKDNLQVFPLPLQFIDPATYRGQEFTRQMVALNEKAYGNEMAAPLWTFANFGTIGAGITGGLMSSGVPISKFSIVGNIWDPSIAHDWTMLVDPVFEGKSLASLTLAFALQSVQDKKYFSFIAQTDQVSINLYLKFPNPLEILSYGFVHTRRNSLLLKTRIPDNVFEVFLHHKPSAYRFDDYVVAQHELPDDRLFWLQANNHQLLLDLNEQLSIGQQYHLGGKCEHEGQIYLLISKDGDV